MAGLVWLVVCVMLRRPGWSFARIFWSPGLLGVMLVIFILRPAGDAAREAEDPVSSGQTLTQLEQQADADIAEAPDPVGMKLAGKSDQLSSSDTELLRDWSPVGARFGVFIDRVLADYNDQSVSGPTWVSSTKKRLRQADRAMGVMRRRASRFEDPAVKAQVVRLNRARSNTLSAFRRLLGAVEDGRTGDEDRATDLVNRRLRQYRRAGQHTFDLMRPYYSAEELRKIEKLREQALS